MKNKNPQVLIKTNLGDIKAELYPEKAPLTVKNFLDYAKSGHYNNTIFHRIIDNFMIQGGGFTKDFKQKPTRLPIQNEAMNGLKNDEGTLSMARTDDPHSATSQFFINIAENDFLNNRGKSPSEFGYCVFGKVIEGMDTLEEMRSVRTGQHGHHYDVPKEAVEIIEVTVV